MTASINLDREGSTPFLAVLFSQLMAEYMEPKFLGHLYALESLPRIQQRNLEYVTVMSEPD
jgi:hypothetical protein